MIDKIESLKDEIDSIDTDINDVYRSVESLQFEIKRIKVDE